MSFTTTLNPLGEESFREHYIDYLRVLATILIVFYHTALIFNLYVDYHIKNQNLSLFFTIITSIIYIWHMPLFFTLAGLGSVYALNKRTGKQYVKERCMRLIIPLIMGIFVLIPPIIYFERYNSYDSYFEFYPQFFIPFYPIGNLTWAHLWFLMYLFFISIILLPLMLRIRKKYKNEESKLILFLQKGKRIFLVSLPILVIEVSLRWIFPHSLNLIYDWTNLLHFSFVFLMGYLLLPNSHIIESIDRNKRKSLILGLIFTSVYIYFACKLGTNLGFIFIFSEILSYILMYTSRAIAEWCLIVSLFGYARKYFKKKSEIMSYFNQISISFYIIHQTILVLLAFYIVQWSCNLYVKYIFISFSTLVITIALCEFIRTNKTSRTLFGMKP